MSKQALSRGHRLATILILSALLWVGLIAFVAWVMVASVDPLSKKDGCSAAIVTLAGECGQ